MNWRQQKEENWSSHRFRWFSSHKHCGKPTENPYNSFCGVNIPTNKDHQRWAWFSCCVIVLCLFELRNHFHLVLFQNVFNANRLSPFIPFCVVYFIIPCSTRILHSNGRVAIKLEFDILFGFVPNSKENRIILAFPFAMCENYSQKKRKPLIALYEWAQLAFFCANKSSLALPFKSIPRLPTDSFVVVFSLFCWIVQLIEDRSFVPYATLHSTLWSSRVSFFYTLCLWQNTSIVGFMDF